MPDSREIPTVEGSFNPKCCAIAILAGGRSSRMGRDKAELELDGERFLTRLCRRLHTSGSPIFVLGAREGAGFDEAVTLADKSPHAGPLAALANLVTALPDATRWIFVAAVDMPMLDRKVAHTLFEEAERHARPVVPELGGRLQPLAAVWSRACLEHADALLARGRARMLDLIREREPHVLRDEQLRGFGIDPALAFCGVNHAHDLAALRARLGTDQK